MNQIDQQQLPPPYDLVFREEQPGPAVAWACRKCGQLFIPGAKDAPEERERKRLEAAAHCVKECVCGKPLDYHYYLRCADCRTQAEKDKEKARFEKAAKVALEDYNGPVYWEGHEGGLGDGYFSGIDEILDYCEEEGTEVPAYVWTCTPHQFKLDGEALIERELEKQEMYEEAGEDITDDARERLQAYLDVWATEQDLTGWRCDYARALVLRTAGSNPPAAVG